MKNTKSGFIGIIIAIIAALIIGGGATYLYIQHQNKTLSQDQIDFGTNNPDDITYQNTGTTTVATSNLATTSQTNIQVNVGISDSAVASVVFPSNEWDISNEAVPGSNKMAVVYRPKGQTGLPILTINSIQRSNDSNDALVSIEFYGADSAQEVKFVHNLLSQPVVLNFPNIDDLGLGNGKISSDSSGFNTDGTFYVTYDSFGNSLKANYQLINGQIAETSTTTVTNQQ